jgi:hypothetical protein
VLEKQIEQRFRLAVKSRGGLSLKLTTPGFTGIPDRLNLLPGGRLFFAEFKYGRGKLSVRQEAVIRVLRGLGFEVWVIDEKNINEYIEKL